MMNRPQIYIQGETFNIGLKWTDLSKTPVDVSTVDEIKVSIINQVFKKTVLIFKKTDGTITVNADKCLITVSSEQTENLNGMHYVCVEIKFGGQKETAIVDTPILFIKHN